MNPASTRPQRGVALLEVLLAFFIVSTAFFTLMAVLPASARAIHKSMTRSLALHVARQQLDNAAALGYHGLPSGTYRIEPDPTLSLTVNGSVQRIPCSCSRSVAVVGPLLKTISCTVSWDDGSITLTTMVSI